MIRKIGILAYNRAINFGASLQVFSTYNYLVNHGYEPYIIDWIPFDLKEQYYRTVPKQQIIVHNKFIAEMRSTSVCHNSKEIANQLIAFGIQAVVIGSDAVVQHHTWKDNIVFPSRHFIDIINRTSDTVFPNPFWGTFEDYLDKKIPLAFLSVSSQNSDYKNYTKSLMRKMCYAVKDIYIYVSVRDTWTQKMFQHFSLGEINPEVTPDPVFAFNYNVPKRYVISKNDILEKYNLPNNYVLVSFLDNKCVSREWLDEFGSLCNINGLNCVAFPFPEGIRFVHNFKYEINVPISPLDWYYIIKYASGYVGQNMHPIIVSLHNSVPFFSFDHYGITHFKMYVESSSSKIYHILNAADFKDYRFESRNILKKRPNPQYVVDKLLHFDKSKCQTFAKEYYRKYCLMMSRICDGFENCCGFTEDR